MAQSPIGRDTGLVTFTIKVDGKPIKDTYQVMTIFIDRAVNRIPFCELEIADGSAREEDFPISDAKTFVPGQKIEIQAGYNNKNKTVFKGIITKHSVSISNNGGPTLVLRCKDKAVKMTIGRHNAYFKEKKDSEIISELIEKYSGLTTEVASTAHQHKELIQYYATDWDFMLTRADVNGLMVSVLDGKVQVMDPEKSKHTELELTYGYDIYDLNLDMDAETQLKAVESSAWGMKNQAIGAGQATVSNSDMGNLSSSELAKVIGLDRFELQTTGFLETDELTTWAKAKTTKSKYAKISGSVKFLGSALAKIGDLIELKGIGKRFNGKGLITGVMHDIQNGEWITTVQIGLSTDWYAANVRTEAPLTAGLLPGIQGLQVGIVQQINDDPAGEFRVLVKLPLIQSREEGVWARLASNYATASAGAFFFPEVGDEVVLGFFNNDARYPVIVGSLYSSSRAAPEVADKHNSIKAFVSREQMKITFDEAKKIITITTPANNQLAFSDEEKSITMSDQNSNSIKLSPNGIELNSASDISIKAVKSITIDGPTGITNTASGGAISLEGLSISCTADTAFSATANTTATVSSAFNVSISGALVKIN